MREPPLRSVHATIAAIAAAFAADRDAKPSYDRDLDPPDLATGPDRTASAPARASFAVTGIEAEWRSGRAVPDGT
jgi:hypothetical protein